jgi:uncharacterized membrane protein
MGVALEPASPWGAAGHHGGIFVIVYPLLPWIGMIAGICGGPVVLNETARSAADGSFGWRAFPVRVFATSHLAWLWGSAAVQHIATPAGTVMSFLN